MGRSIGKTPGNGRDDPGGKPAVGGGSSQDTGRTNNQFYGVCPARCGSGGDPGLDGLPSVTAVPALDIMARGGQGGKAGYVVANNRKNVIITNRTGLIRGY